MAPSNFSGVPPGRANAAAVGVVPPVRNRRGKRYGLTTLGDRVSRTPADPTGTARLHLLARWYQHTPTSRSCRVPRRRTTAVPPVTGICCGRGRFFLHNIHGHTNAIWRVSDPGALSNRWRTTLWLLIDHGHNILCYQYLYTYKSMPRLPYYSSSIQIRRSYSSFFLHVCRDSTRYAFSLNDRCVCLISSQRLKCLNSVIQYHAKSDFQTDPGSAAQALGTHIDQYPN